MRGNSKVVVWLVLLGTALPVQAMQDDGSRARFYLRRLADAATAVVAEIDKTDTEFPAVRSFLWNELRADRPAHYRSALEGLFIESRRSGVSEDMLVIRIITLTQWGSRVGADAALLQRESDWTGFPSEPIVRKLETLHASYVRFVVATYVLLEGWKRAYLLPQPDQEIGPEKRLRLLNQAVAIHKAIQRAMVLMLGLRQVPHLADAIPYHERGPRGAWETLYGEIFHFGLEMRVGVDRDYVSRDITRYLGGLDRFAGFTAGTTPGVEPPKVTETVGPRPKPPQLPSVTEPPPPGGTPEPKPPPRLDPSTTG